MVRASAERWARVSGLCRQLQRVVRHNARLDVMGRGNWKERLDAAAGIEDELERLQQVVDEEIGRVTCELLQSELARRKRKDQR